MMGDDDEVLEHTLLVVREVNVFKVPPRNTSGGYKCAEWLVSSKIWSGRLRIVAVKEVCEIRLEDLNSGELFATCRVLPGQREAFVQNAVDSSRYFVLKIDDGRGRHAFIGLGFNDRNEAFDFNVALTDHEKHALLEKSRPPEQPLSSSEQSLHGSSAAAAPSAPSAPSADFKLKEGETIKINIAKPTSAGLSKPLAIGGSSGGAFRLAPPPGGAGGLKLAPPPGSTAPKLAPPAAAPAAPMVQQKPAPSSSNQSGGTKPPAAGWTNF